MKKVLFLVPHEDDELFVGGPMLINLVRSGQYEVSVYIATNGDYYPFEPAIRAKESIKVLKNIGVEEQNIYFGGYGDSWTEGHIYNKEENELQVSRAGHSETYMDVAGYNDWHYIHTGEHAGYTRNNYREDIKSLIVEIRPEVIVCVDMDANPDHRCLSLLTDEAVCAILRENPLYRPILLKKYSYNGMQFGDEDYFREYPNPVTRISRKSLVNPYLPWNEAIRYSVPKDCNTLLLCRNYLNKLGRMYKSQEIMFNVGKFTNSDVIYWKRNTDNVLLDAEISVTSGDASYLNDFKLLDSADISVRDCDYYSLSWRPDRTDSHAVISIGLKKQVALNELLMYFANTEGDEAAEVSVRTYDDKGSLVCEKNMHGLHKGQYIAHVEFEGELPVSRIEITVSSANGSVGLTEIESLTGEAEIPFCELLYKEQHAPVVSSAMFKFIKKSEKMYMNLKYRLYRYFDSYRRKRRRYDRNHQDNR